MPPITSIATLDRLERIGAWIDPAVRLFQDPDVATPVHVAFSPGDATCYAMVFVPPRIARLATPGEYPRVQLEDALLALIYPESKAVAIAYNGTPFPDYVAEHLRLTNEPTIAAVGVVWAFMVGNTAPEVARMFEGLAGYIAAWTDPR